MIQTVMVFSPHPDDAEFHAGGTMAAMAQTGSRIIPVVVTDGRCGSFHLNGDSLAGLRAEEAREAAKALGAEPPILLGYPDMSLDGLPPGTLRQDFLRLLRTYQPDIVISPDAAGPWDVHPDHRAVAIAASEAVLFAPLPLASPRHAEEGLRPHFVVEKYFWTKLDHANHIVDISESMERKLAALARHESQMRFLVEDILRQADKAGLELGELSEIARREPALAMRWALEAEAAEIGAKAGYRYGEAFRKVRFHPLVERLLSQKE